MYATMIACAFASCSKDDEVINGGETTGDGKTYLEVQAQAPATAATKADATDASAGINTLTLIVFNGNTIEAIESNTQGQGAISRKVEVTPGAKKVMVLANVTLPSTIVKGSALSAVVDLTKDFDATEVDGTLTMNSGLYNADVKAGKINYLGYNVSAETATAYYNPVTYAPAEGVKLYRNVARIHLATVKVKDVLGSGNTQYPEAELTVKRVFVLNANKTTLLAGTGEEWSANRAASAWLAGLVRGTATWGTKYSYFDATSATASMMYELGTAITAAAPKTVNGAAVDAVDAAINHDFYVYESAGNQNVAAEAAGANKTLLVVEGDFSYKGANGRVTLANRYYPLAVGRTGFDSAYSLPAGFTNLRTANATTAYDVLRNLQYNITITVKGIGYTTPTGGEDSQYLDVQCQVVPFGTVDQEVEI